MNANELQLMMKIGMPLSNIGTAYVVECLDEMQKKEYLKFSDLYKVVADNHHTKPENVEKCMSKAFNSARDKPIDYNTVDKYLGYARTGTGETLVHLLVRYKIENETK